MCVYEGKLINVKIMTTFNVYEKHRRRVKQIYIHSLVCNLSYIYDMLYIKMLTTVTWPFPSYDNSVAHDFEHILSKDRKSL